MVRLRVLFGLMIGTGLMCLGLGYERGKRSSTVEKESAASAPVCSIADAPVVQGSSTSLPYSNRWKTICVRRFKVESAHAGLGGGIASEFTKAVVKALEARTPYKVIASRDADMELTGIIEDFRQQEPPGGLNSGSDMREIETHLVVQLTWKDLRTGQSLLPQQEGSGPATVELRSVAYYRPELGESIEQPRQENIKGVVEQMLAQMETPW